MTSTSRPPAMSDVARMAGVSAQTVSRVLSEHAHVSRETRERVLAAVERSGYLRNRTARALVTGRSQTLGLVLHESGHFSSTAILLGIQAEARDRGFFVSVASVPSPAPGVVRGAVSRLLDQGVDGLLVAVPYRQDDELQRLARGRPLVVVDQQHQLDRAEPRAIDTVAVDQVAAGRLATEHLLGLGHETVWHLSGPASWADAMGRADGWQQSLQAAGRTVPPLLYGDWTPESGYRHGRLLGSVTEVGAVFVASDEMAFGLVRGLLERGRRVPGDVAVVGMDDIALAAHCNPPLTTVRQPFHTLGRRCVSHLLDRLADPGLPAQPELLTPELVVRASSGRADPPPG